MEKKNDVMQTELCLNSQNRHTANLNSCFIQNINQERLRENLVFFNLSIHFFKKRKKTTIHFYTVLPCIFAILVSMIFPLPCHYQAFIQLPRACQRLAQPAMVLALWAASPFPSGRLASSTPQGNHAALCQFEPQPQNTRVGPLWLAGWRVCGVEAGERKLRRACGSTGIPLFSPLTLSVQLERAFVVEMDSLNFQ